MKRLAFILVLCCAGTAWGDIRIGSGESSGIRIYGDAPDMSGVEHELRGIRLELEMQNLYGGRPIGGGGGVPAPAKKHTFRDIPPSAWAPGAYQRAVKQDNRIKRAALMREKKAAKRERARAK